MLNTFIRAQVFTRPARRSSIIPGCYKKSIRAAGLTADIAALYENDQEEERAEVLPGCFPLLQRVIILQARIFPAV